MRIQLELPDATVTRLRQLMDEVEIKTYSEVFGNALTGLEWMVKERRAGRLIISADPDIRQLKELSMPILDAVKPPAPVAVPGSMYTSASPAAPVAAGAQDRKEELAEVGRK